MVVPTSAASCTCVHRPDDDRLHPSHCGPDAAPRCTARDSHRAAGAAVAGRLMDPRASLPSVAPRVVVMLCLWHAIVESQNRQTPKRVQYPLPPWSVRFPRRGPVGVRVSRTVIRVGASVGQASDRGPSTLYRERGVESLPRQLDRPSPDAEPMGHLFMGPAICKMLQDESRRTYMPRRAAQSRRGGITPQGRERSHAYV